MIGRKFAAVLIALMGIFGTGCKESRNDLNRGLVSAGLPHVSDQKSKQVSFSGRRLPVYFGNDQSEAANGYRKACCSKEPIGSLDPLTAQSVKKSGVYRTVIAKDVYLLMGVPYDGIAIRELQFYVHAKCSEQHFVVAALNHEELPAIYSKPQALCNATAP